MQLHDNIYIGLIASVNVREHQVIQLNCNVCNKIKQISA